MGVPWIKMRINLLDDPRVRLIAKRIGCNAVSVTGGLYMLWSLADQYSADGLLNGYDADDLDRKFGKAGFAAALASPEVDWIEVGDNFLRVKRFEEHNGAGGKARAQVGARVTRHRKSVTVAPLQNRYQNKNKNRGIKKGAKAPCSHKANGVKGNPQPAESGEGAGKASTPAEPAQADPKAKPNGRVRRTRKAKDEPRPEHAALREHFCARWKRLYRADYPWKFSRDDAHVKWILDECGRDLARAKAIVDAYVSDPDTFLAREHHPLGLLVSKFARFTGEGPPPDGVIDTDQIEGTDEATADFLLGVTAAAADPSPNPNANGRHE